MERVHSGIKHLGGKRKLKECKVSQTSFGHISINFFNDSYGLNGYKKPSKNLLINVLRQSILAEILSKSTGNYHVTIY